MLHGQPGALYQDHWLWAAQSPFDLRVRIGKVWSWGQDWWGIPLGLRYLFLADWRSFQCLWRRKSLIWPLMSQSHPELGCCSQETWTPQLTWVPQKSLNFMMNITYSDGDCNDTTALMGYSGSDIDRMKRTMTCGCGSKGWWHFIPLQLSHRQLTKVSSNIRHLTLADSLVWHLSVKFCLVVICEIVVRRPNCTVNEFNFMCPKIIPELSARIISRMLSMPE